MNPPDPRAARVTPDEALELFQYLRYPAAPAGWGLGDFHPAEAVLAFGRVDPLVAKGAATLYSLGLAPVVGFTGGTGKDSGPVLTEWSVPEAVFLAALAGYHGVPWEAMVIEPEAKHGSQNCHLGYQAIQARLGRPPRRLILVIHATSARRLAEIFLTLMEQEGWPTVNLQICATEYKFNPNNSTDRAEAAAELLRLAEWPHKKIGGNPWLRPQPDLPPHLVGIARRIVAEQPAP